MVEIKSESNSTESVLNNSFGGYISTPFFPTSYSDDLTFEQVVNCKIATCLVHLIFVDFQIAEESIVEVSRYDPRVINYPPEYYSTRVKFNFN